MKKSKKDRPYNGVNLWKRNFQIVSLEEVIKPIYRKFLEPFMMNQPMSPHDVVRLWFDFDNREVLFAIAKKATMIPGRIRHPDNHQDFVPLAERREVKKGEQVVVRFDAKRPAFVELEYNETVFTMKVEEWNSISGSIALVG